jgi:putative ABC transport system substrate-binding protein
MDRGLIDNFEIKLKSAFSNLKSAILLGAFLLAISVSAEAQQQAKVHKIGWLGTRPASGPTAGSGLIRRELQALGYVEGKNIAFEHRYTEGKLDRLPVLADELARLKVDVLLTFSTPNARAVKKVTSTIPIVFITAGDPIASGLVHSLARPGGNITGFTTISPLLVGKRLELLKETVPKVSRVAILWSQKGSIQQWKDSQLPARELGLELHSMEVTSTDKYEIAFEEALKAGCDALVVGGSSLDNLNQKRIAALATKHRLPAIYPRADYIASGGLMSYGADRFEPYKRVTSMVDKILRGTKPADIPVEQPKKFELVINLKTAKEIGLTIPPNVLARADRVIR